MVEPAAAVTDYLLAVVTVVLGVSLLTERNARVHWYWPLGFFSMALGALVGGVYHGHLHDMESVADHTWTAITIIVAVTVSLLLAATVQSVLEARGARFWMTVRLGSLLGYGALAIAGYGGLTTFFILEAGSMMAVLGIWGYAVWKRQPGADLVMLAIFLSGGAALFRFTPVGFEAGWEWDRNAIYHLAQIPGLVALYYGVLRLGQPEAVEFAGAPLQGGDARVRAG